MSDFPQWHPRSPEARAGLPGIIPPALDFTDLAITHSEQKRTAKPRESLTGDTKLADLPIESGNYRAPAMQTAYFNRRPDMLGEVPFSGIHGVVVPLAQPSQYQGDPDYYEQGYLVRQVPSSASDDLGLIVG